MKKARSLLRFYIFLCLGTVSILFFFSSEKVFAAVSIINISTTTINTVDDVITITATASGLQNNTQYMQVLFSKDSGGYLGLTKNLQDEWYQYKSSPTTTDFSTYFYSFTPSGGGWSGDIQAKIDTSDSDYKGPGNYTVKLAKYLSSSSPTYSTNTFSITVNIAPPPTETPIPNTPTKVPPTPTKNIQPTNTPIPLLTVKPLATTTSLSLTSSKNGKTLGSSTKSAVLKLATPTSSKKPRPTVKVEGIQDQQDLLPFFFIGGGILLLVACAILTFQSQLRKLWKKE